MYYGVLGGWGLVGRCTKSKLIHMSLSESVLYGAYRVNCERVDASMKSFAYFCMHISLSVTAVYCV